MLFLVTESKPIFISFRLNKMIVANNLAQSAEDSPQPPETPQTPQTPVQPSTATTQPAPPVVTALQARDYYARLAGPSPLRSEYSVVSQIPNGAMNGGGKPKDSPLPTDAPPAVGVAPRNIYSQLTPPRRASPMPDSTPASPAVEPSSAAASPGGEATDLGKTIPNIYGAVYSGVPVYEMMCRSIAVMRRKADSHLNATQILKVALIEKGRRTKILEREVMIGDHEKVQGGYGKYQGTWVPFQRGVELAQQFEVEHLLRPLLEFQPPRSGAADHTPTKEQVMAATKALLKKSKGTGSTGKRKKADPKQQSPVRFKTPKSEVEATPSPEPEVSADEGSPSSRKKQKVGEDPRHVPDFLTQPNPPSDLDMNLVIDEMGHASLHWAAALARITILRLLIQRGADVRRKNFDGESALMRAVLVTNNYDSQTFPELLELLHSTLLMRDSRDQTVLHHICQTASDKRRAAPCRYYMECLLEWIARHGGDFESIVDLRDVNGDTALNVAARVGSRNLVSQLIDVGADPGIANRAGLRPADFGFADLCYDDATKAPEPVVEIDEQRLERDVSPDGTITDPATAASSPRSLSPVDGPATRVVYPGILTAQENSAISRNAASEPRERELVTAVQKAYSELSISFADEMRAKAEHLQQTQMTLHQVTRELAELRRQNDILRRQSRIMPEMSERIKNLERCLGEELSRNARNAVFSHPDAGADYQQQQQQQDELSPQSNGVVGGPNSAFTPVGNSHSDPQTLITLASQIAHLRHELQQKETAERKLLEELVQLRGQTGQQEIRCKRIIAACCEVDISEVDALVAPLLRAVESDGPVELKDVAGAYSQLKKIIYAIEKATLGLRPLPASPHDIETGEGDQGQQGQEVEEDERSPLLVSPISPEDANAFFVKALDEQLEKISTFYMRKEGDLVSEVESLANDISQVETHDGAYLLAQSALPPNFDSYGRATGQPLLSPVAHTPEIQAHGGSSPRQPRRRATISEAQSGIDEDRQRYTAAVIWASKGLKQHRQRFKKRLTESFTNLNELKDFIELNYTGFSKILKKYDKVTGNKLRRSYLASKVDAAYPFRPDTKARLEHSVGKVVDLYARALMDGKADLALTDLKANLREHIVWERNTIWRDMIERERKRETIGLRPQVAEGLSLTHWQFNCLGMRCSIPLMPRKVFLFLASTAIFLGLLYLDTFEAVEQRNCFALLVYVSLLWAFEVLPLFVTALLVPFLVVTLQVMREPANTGSDSDWKRLDAKAAAKKIASDMFSPVIMLLLGGFSLAAALSKHHIAKGLASFVLGKAGSRPQAVLLANMFVSTFASMWISNVAAPVLCFSLIAPILRNLPHRSPYARCLIMGIAMASNVGGMASPISSPQNIVAIGIIDPAPTWLEWFMIALPVVVTVDLIIWGILLAIYQPSDTEATAPPEIFGKSYFRDHPLTKTQWFVLLVTAVTIALWCTESAMEGWVGDMGIVAIVPIVAFFGTGILTKDDWNGMLWNVVILAMGGIALGKAVDSSGLLAKITHTLSPHLVDLSPFHCLVLFSGIVLVITSFISHTVGALIILPVVLQVGSSLPDPRPRTLVMASALMCSGAMGLPVSSFPNMNAISLEDPTGVPWLGVSDFIKIGLPSSVVAWGCIMTIGYFVMGLLDFH
ncbi:low-affinity phosphate transporter [Borealophlyctis nickersoniae]|nr:low-affinity phosphate transporter [Borealophlyctis nickersoniae]